MTFQHKSRSTSLYVQPEGVGWEDKEWAERAFSSLDHSCWGHPPLKIIPLVFMHVVLSWPPRLGYIKPTSLVFSFPPHGGYWHHDTMMAFEGAVCWCKRLNCFSELLEGNVGLSMVFSALIEILEKIQWRPNFRETFLSFESCQLMSFTEGSVELRCQHGRFISAHNRSYGVNLWSQIILLCGFLKRD